MTSLSRSPQAFAASSGSVICFALSIWAFSFGSSTSAVLTLPDGTMFLPLNSGSMKLCAAKKSAPQPRFGQIADVRLRHLAELRVSIVACGTCAELQLEADLRDLLWNASAVSFAGDSLSATVSSGGPSYMPFS